MKVICNRGSLLEALQTAGTVVATRTPKPVLQCVKLSAGDNKLMVSATDLEVSIKYIDTQVEVQEPGEALVPADKLRDIVRESLDDTLSIEISGDSAHIKGQDSHFKLFTQPLGDYPPIPEFTSSSADLTVSAGTLRQLVSQTLFAAAKETNRYAMNGVLLLGKGPKISLVSTDGRRLAQARSEGTPGEFANDAVRAIIPAKALGLTEKLLGDPEEMVTIQIQENQAIFHTDSATLTTNLIEGQFPPFGDVIPKEADKLMTAGTGDFLSAVKRASLLTSEESKGVRLKFGKKGLVLTSSSADSGDATVNFPCKYEGAELEMGFNPAYLIDALKVVDTDEVTFEMTAANRPGLLRAGDGFLYVIMPVSLT